MERLEDKESDSYLTRQRIYLIFSRWLSAQYNWEIDTDKTLIRSIERLIKGKIAEQDKKTADQLERELMRVNRFKL